MHLINHFLLPANITHVYQSMEPLSFQEEVCCFGTKEFNSSLMEAHLDQLILKLLDSVILGSGPSAFTGQL